MFTNIKNFINDPKVQQVAYTTVAVATAVLIIYVNVKIQEQKVDYLVDKIIQGIEAGNKG